MTFINILGLKKKYFSNFIQNIQKIRFGMGSKSNQNTCYNLLFTFLLKRELFSILASICNYRAFVNMVYTAFKKNRGLMVVRIKVLLNKRTGIFRKTTDFVCLIDSFTAIFISNIYNADNERNEYLLKTAIRCSKFNFLLNSTPVS